MKTQDIDAVVFKSLPEFFYREKYGLKRNTLREIEEEDSRFQRLKYHLLVMHREELHIKIVNSSNQEFFLRRITDIHYTNKNQVLISWG